MRKRKAKASGFERIGALSGDAKEVYQSTDGTKVYIDQEDNDAIYIVRYEPVVYRLRRKGDR